MSFPSRYNQPFMMQQNRNKENNLSFRNIANNINLNNQNTSQNYLKINKFDKSFKSNFANQSSSFQYNPIDHLQQDPGFDGCCLNHPTKKAEYIEVASRTFYCKLCAAKMASLGHKLEKSQSFTPRDISPSMNRIKLKQQPKPTKYPNEVFQSNIRSQNSVINPSTIKFSSLISQKNSQQSLQTKYMESESIINSYMQMYTQKMDKIQELINDIRIKDMQYVNKLKNQNKSTYDEAKLREQTETDKSSYDIFGKSILRECHSSEGLKYSLPSEQRLETLNRIVQFISNQLMSQRFQNTSYNKIPLIKSINSNQSNQNNQPREVVLKSSLSVSNLSTKSNFKKQKKETQKTDKFGSEINETKKYQKKNQDQIESSRFSSNSAIIRKKDLQSNKACTKTESTELRRRNTAEISFEDSSSPLDTPESIKSKISANSFVLPKNVAVTMFEKINVCESIDIKPEESLEIARVVELDGIKDDQGPRFEQELEQKGSSQYAKSRYVTRSNKKSGQSKSRKSFNRYTNIDNQQ